MDILEFIDSNTVYKHLIDIGYEPDALTAAVIVWQSKSHNLAEKEKAFKWIIENMKDMSIPAHEYHSERASLHEFLATYIETLSRYVDGFKLDHLDAIYDFSTYYKAPDNAWVSDDNLYSSYENVFDAALHSFPQNYDDYPDAPRPFLFKIRRRTLDFELGSDYLYLTPNLEPYKLCMDTIIPDEDYEVLHLFENICLPIPHPFKKGDIIRECRKYSIPFYNDTLVVTDFMSEEEIKEKYSTLCMHDYTLYGICSDGEGGSYNDSINHYLYAELVNPADVLIKDCILLEKAEELKNGN
jgi:hypothetical protein